MTPSPASVATRKIWREPLRSAWIFSDCFETTAVFPPAHDNEAAWNDWRFVPRVGRDVASNLDRRLRLIDDRVRAAMDSAWRRTTPDDNPLLAQMREQVAEAEARLARAQAAGDAKRVREAQEALEAKRKFLDLAEHSS